MVRQTNVRIRRAVPEDAPAIVQLLRELARFERMERECTPKTSAIGQHLKPGVQELKLHGFVAETPKEELVGYVLCYVGDYSSFSGTWRMCLHDIYVEEEYRRRGVGRALLQKVADITRKMHFPELVLEVLDWNAEALAAYTHLGAVNVGHRVDEEGRTWIRMIFRGTALKGLARH